jgi:hypothetical protein
MHVSFEVPYVWNYYVGKTQKLSRIIIIIIIIIIELST